MNIKLIVTKVLLPVAVLLLVCAVLASAVQQRAASSYAPVVVTEDFQTTMTRMNAEKASIIDRQMQLLRQRYDLSDNPASAVTMSRGKAVQQGVRVKLPQDITWQNLADDTG